VQVETNTPSLPRTAPLALGLAWLVAVVMVGPAGDFALGDDWAYAWAAKSLCENGRLDLLPWAAPSLLAHAAWGALVCLVGGFSFELLRLGTLLFAASGLVAFYLLLARCSSSSRSGSRGSVLLATATLAFSPLYFGLSFTFMTEIPCLALCLWAALLYLRGLQDDKPGSLLAAAAVIAVAVLVRQNVLLLAVAAAASAWRFPPGRLTRVAAAARCLLLPLASVVAYYAWLLNWQGAPAGAAIRLSDIASATPLRVIDVALRAWLTLGLLAAPLLIRSSLSRDRLLRIGLPAGLLLTVAACLFASRTGAGFALPNLLHAGGTGALTLRDTLFLGMASPFDGSTAARTAISAASVLLSTLLFARLLPTRLSLREALDTPARCLLSLAAALLLAGSLLQADFYFDRYLLPALPFVLALLAMADNDGEGRAAVTGLSLALLAAMTFYSVAGTHDYMQWNRARHHLLGELEARGVAATEIDGGVEYNGWRLAPVKRDWPTIEEATPGRSPEKKSWWWVEDDRWVVSFTALEGYRVADRRQWQRWLPPSAGEVLLLERER
jgi:hypothetical protein